MMVVEMRTESVNTCSRKYPGTLVALDPKPVCFAGAKIMKRNRSIGWRRRITWRLIVIKIVDYSNWQVVQALLQIRNRRVRQQEYWWNILAPALWLLRLNTFRKTDKDQEGNKRVKVCFFFRKSWLSPSIVCFNWGIFPLSLSVCLPL